MFSNDYEFWQYGMHIQIYFCLFQIQNNVCYNTFGHGFFIEDGGEKHTFFEGNLGLGQKRWTGQVNHPVTGALPSDRYMYATGDT